MLLEGEFRASARDRRRLWLHATLLVVLTGIMTLMVAWVRWSAELPAARGKVDILLVVIPLLSLLAPLVVQRGRIRYVFKAGTVAAIDESNRTMWVESLVGLADAWCWRRKGYIGLTLKWPGRRRVIEVFEPLLHALSDDSKEVQNP